MPILLGVVLYEGGGRSGSLTLISSSIVWLFCHKIVVKSYE